MTESNNHTYATTIQLDPFSSNYQPMTKELGDFEEHVYETIPEDQVGTRGSEDAAVIKSHLHAFSLI